MITQVVAQYVVLGLCFFGTHVLLYVTPEIKLRGFE